MLMLASFVVEDGDECEYEEGSECEVEPTLSNHTANDHIDVFEFYNLFDYLLNER
jgi:hypothetical protein